MSEPYIGEIRMFAFGTRGAPVNWQACDGSLLPISQYDTLFALIGTTYGGDGQNTFGLPDLRGRVPVGSQGVGPGLSAITQGEKAGTNTTTVIGSGQASISLTAANLPPHTHPASFSPTGLTATTQVQASTGTTGTSTAPANGSVLSASPSGPSSAWHRP